MLHVLLLKNFKTEYAILQCNLSKPDPNGTIYFVRFEQDPDYSDSTFCKELLYCSCFDNKVCLSPLSEAKYMQL